MPRQPFIDTIPHVAAQENLRFFWHLDVHLRRKSHRAHVAGMLILVARIPPACVRGRAFVAGATLNCRQGAPSPSQRFRFAGRSMQGG